MGEWHSFDDQAILLNYCPLYYLVLINYVANWILNNVLDKLGQCHCLNDQAAQLNNFQTLYLYLGHAYEGMHMRAYEGMHRDAYEGNDGQG